MQTSNRPKKSHRWLLSIVPSSLWLTCFLLLPFLAIVAVSFFSRGDYGEIERPLTFENYARLAGYGELGFDSAYPLIFGRSLLLATATAVLCALFALPLAFFIASLKGTARTSALTLVIIPVWTNLLVRTYAWQLLLAPEGVTGWAFRLIGLPAPEWIYPGNFAVMIGMVCDFLPFAVLPLFASVEKIDWTLSDAARDLGASGLNLFRHAILPQIKPGLTAGLLLVLLPAMGQFVIPDLLGGSKTILLGNVLQQQFGPSRDWPFGAAITVAASLAVMLALLLYFKLVNKGKEIDLV